MNEKKINKEKTITTTTKSRTIITNQNKGKKDNRNLNLKKIKKISLYIFYFLFFIFTIFFGYKTYSNYTYQNKEKLLLLEIQDILNNKIYNDDIENKGVSGLNHVLKDYQLLQKKKKTKENIYNIANILVLQKDYKGANFLYKNLIDKECINDKEKYSNKDKKFCSKLIYNFSYTEYLNKNINGLKEKNIESIITLLGKSLYFDFNEKSFNGIKELLLMLNNKNNNCDVNIENNEESNQKKTNNKGNQKNQNNKDNNKDNNDKSDNDKSNNKKNNGNSSSYHNEKGNKQEGNEKFINLSKDKNNELENYLNYLKEEENGNKKYFKQEDKNKNIDSKDGLTKFKDW